jgi:hypothetical protein
MSNRSCPALQRSWAVRGIEADRRLHPLVVWRRLSGRCGCRHLSTQILDDATGGDVPRTFEHNVECLTTLVVAGHRVRMVVYGLEVPFGLLEPQSILLVLLGVFLLFALPLAGRCVIVPLLLQLLAVLFCEFLDFPALLSVVAHRVVHWATRASIIAVGRLTGVLVTSGTLALARHGSNSYDSAPSSFSCSCSCCYLSRQ